MERAEEGTAELTAGQRVIAVFETEPLCEGVVDQVLRRQVTVGGVEVADEPVYCVVLDEPRNGLTQFMLPAERYKGPWLGYPGGGALGLEIPEVPMMPCVDLPVTLTDDEFEDEICMPTLQELAQ